MEASLRVDRVVSEGQAIERALFWGRCAGGLIIVGLGPLVTPDAPEILIRALGVYFFAYAFAMLPIVARATSPASRQRAQWLAHGFDTVGFLSALALNATDPGWLAVYAAPLYILVAVTRLGAIGGVIASSALSITHIALAVWREASLGIQLDASRTLVHLAVYGLAALLAGALDVELRRLRARREIQVAVHEPLLQAHDAMQEGVLISEDGRPVYASDGFLALTGWSREEIMALESSFDLVLEEARPAAIELTGSLPAGGGMLTTALRRKDGTRIEVEVALRRYDQDGRARSVAIVRDITARERTLKELDRMQRLDGLGALAGGIGHDFNNLLAIILNNAHLAADSVSGDEKLRVELEGITAAAERGASLTRQMLVFARGAQARRTEAIDVQREVRYVERLLRRTIGGRITLDVRISSDVRGVLLEPGQLEQILMNLTVNARDAMPDGGTILVAIAEVENDGDHVPMLPSGRYVRVVVRDDGSGMTPEVAAHAFEPFFTTKPKGRGTGLGLSTVYGIVRRAGGHVSVSSTLGVGTAITIHLPAAASVAVVESATAGTVDPSSGERILVVDDEDGVRRVAAEILRRAGYQVVEAPHASEALGLASRGIDLLVCDVVLPGMSGRELAARLRERAPSLPVLFISGYAPAETDAEDPSLLAKPFTPDMLLARAREALRTPVEVT